MGTWQPQRAAAWVFGELRTFLLDFIRPVLVVAKMAEARDGMANGRVKCGPQRAAEQRGGAVRARHQAGPNIVKRRSHSGLAMCIREALQGLHVCGARVCRIAFRTRGICFGTSKTATCAAPPSCPR